jgi:transcriptional regulator with XRE-family HTH domain
MAGLLYFIADADGHVSKAPHPELGAYLTALKAARGISQQRLARLAGVSRRHVVVALSGGNITVSILKKLLVALRATEVQLGPLTTAHGTLVPGSDPSTLLAATQQVEQAIAMLANAAVTLRGASQPAPPVAALDAEAAALVDRFIARVQEIKDPRELASLRKVMDQTSRTEDPALHRPPKPPRSSRRAKLA